MSQHLTDRLIRSLPSPRRGYTLTYDDAVPGLAVRTTAAGAKSFTLDYRTADGQTRRLTIGTLAEGWTIKNAREKAEDFKYTIRGGADPVAEQQSARTAPTISGLADRFEQQHLSKKRAGTQDEYQRLLRLYIRPLVGTVKVVALRHADIERMHSKISERAPTSANRAVAVLSKMLSLAVKWEMRPDNPCRGIKRNPERKRQRYLTPAEIARLSETLASHPERASANAVRLLLLTGARKGETFRAKWSDIDLQAGTWTKPGATTKQGTEHRVPLSAPALTLLTEMKAEADKENDRRVREGLSRIPYLFPSLDEKPLGDVKHFWTSVCRRANLTGVRIHDLRHTHAAILASAGLSLPIIGALLGHTQAATTHRYAHLLDDPLRKAAETAGAIIAGKT